MENLVGLNEDNAREFYSSKKIFITGHTGFKGAWLSLWLSDLGAIVKGYSLPPQYKNGMFDFLSDEIFDSSEYGDIRNFEQLSNSIKDFQPDLIFHLAAQPLVRKSYDKPLDTFETNIIGTANVLQALQKVKKKCACIVITTDKVYKNSEDGRLYSENDLLGGYDPYSSSKACAELITESFRNSFFNVSTYSNHLKCIATARAGNVIGGGDWSEDRLIPDILRNLQSNTNIEIRNPASIRPWQHVLEPLAGYLQLGKLLYNNPKSFSEAFNFGPEKQDHYTVGEIVEQTIEAWGEGQWIKARSDHQKHEAGLLQLDISKAKSVLGWRPKLKGSEAIKWTVEWYKSAPDDKLLTARRQILNYLRS